MRRMFFLMSFGIGAAMLGITHGYAKDLPCGDHDEIAARLAESFGEYRHALHVRDDNAVVEVFHSPAAGSWTTTLTPPGQLTCLIGAGQGYNPAGLPTTWSASEKPA